jgi:anti-sigma B factor antagonist
MDIKIEMANEVVVLIPIGDLVASTAEFFKSQVAKILEKRFVNILIDMSKIAFMDSSGLGACMSVNKSITEQAGVLVCCGQNEAIAKVFKITHAIKRITVVEGRQEGLAKIHDLIAARKTS